jgi:iron complex transport system permease protein
MVMPRRSLWPPLATLALLGLAALLLSVTQGSAALTLVDVWAVARGEGSPLARTLILDLRVPRSLSAFAVGGLLAVAGALMQVLLRNPLADPYVLGLSGGASVGALAAMLAGLGGAVSPAPPLPGPFSHTAGVRPGPWHR